MQEKSKTNSNKKESATSSSNIPTSNSINNTTTNIQNINNIVPPANDSKSTQEPPNENSFNPNNAFNAGTENRINNNTTNLQNINTIILSGIEAAESIQNQLSQTDLASDSSNSTNATTTNNANTTSSSSTASIIDCIDKAASTLQDINNIKLQLARLDLDPRQVAYYENSIVPLLTTLRELSTTSVNLATSSNLLSTSIVVSAKHSKIKDTIHLVYDLNEDCEDVYKALKRKIDILLDLS